MLGDGTVRAFGGGSASTGTGERRGQSIVPASRTSSTLPAPTNLVFADQPVPKITWNAVSGASSYSVYVNDTEVASGLTGTSYTLNVSAWKVDRLYKVQVTTVNAWGESTRGSYVLAYKPNSGMVRMTDGGRTHSVAVKNDGTVVAWGDNSLGQTNVPLNLSDVIAVAAGGNHTLALKKNGEVVAWGSNDYGQRNVPNEAMSGVVEIAAGLAHSLALKADGTVVSWGAGSTATGCNGNVSTTVLECGQWASGRDIVEIAAGDRHSIVLKSDGTVQTFGKYIAGTSTTGVLALGSRRLRRVGGGLGQAGTSAG